MSFIRPESVSQSPCWTPVAGFSCWVFQLKSFFRTTGGNFQELEFEAEAKWSSELRLTTTRWQLATGSWQLATSKWKEHFDNLAWGKYEVLKKHASKFQEKRLKFIHQDNQHLSRNNFAHLCKLDLQFLAFAGFLQCQYSEHKTGFFNNGKS